MDLNHQYSEHQRALIGANLATNDNDRLARLATASHIAERISVFQHSLGAAAACAWSKAQFVAAPAVMKGHSPTA
ncbi:hypothetical protein GRI62_12295 [Erythrobacter arachoides]|uniref:Uncharacterized protein n=1 Tax=Aurantiacibacter arachoides TaxID=1850444 RepID=A0A845A620_9SPHN|nr:hypothetical protein [Aurantiacibacter arachoides]MXO94377.1 hypothetical protein [Aurantiacibacter arachoides]GGD63947.1 hypothetical protein GCM10011411_25300 [Aurantiacibacter arachoides]